MCVDKFCDFGGCVWWCGWCEWKKLMMVLSYLFGCLKLVG